MEYFTCVNQNEYIINMVSDRYSNMNIIHNSQQKLSINNAHLLSDVINFAPKKQFIKSRKRGWICNLSQQFIFSQQHHEYLQIQTTEKFSQFTLICKLLEADTCRIIYFDDQLTPTELAELRKMQHGSQTELLHAKVAYMFSAEVSNLYG